VGHGSVISLSLNLWQVLLSLFIFVKLSVLVDTDKKCKIRRVSIRAMNHIFLPSFIMKPSNMDVIKKKNRVRTDLLNSEFIDRRNLNSSIF
jgi:hypothetical protein